MSVTGDDVVDGRWHAWVERDAACAGCQSRFRPETAERIQDELDAPVVAGLHSLAATNLGGDEPPDEDSPALFTHCSSQGVSPEPTTSPSPSPPSPSEAMRP